MKNLLYSHFILCLFIALLSLPFRSNAQTIHKKSEIPELAFRFNVSYPTHYNANRSNSSFRNALERDLFSENFIFGLEADYFFEENWAISPGISFTYSNAEQTNAIFFVIPPPPDAITVFKTDYKFFSASLEPKIKLFVPYSKFDFFWTAGPIISYGSLSSETDGAPYSNQDNFRPFESSSSRSLGYGFTVSTGVQIAFANNFSLSLEAGYRFLNFSRFSLENPTHSEEPDSFNYRLNSFTPSLGIVYQHK